MKKRLKKNYQKVRNSRKLYIPIYIMVLILISAILFIKIKGLPLNKSAILFVIIFSLISLKLTEVHRFKNKYKIKPPSLVHIEGYLNKISRRVDLIAISDVDASQTFWQRLLNYGDVHVRLFSKESTTNIKNINDPIGFTKFLEKKMDEQRKGGNKNVPYP